MSNALRDRILAISDIKTERLLVPDWGVEFDVRGLTGTERARIKAASVVAERDDEDKITHRHDEATMYALLIIAATFDPATGQRVFGDADRDALKEKSAGVLEDVAMAICRLSGITPDAVKAIRKNSEPTPSGSSPSA